MQEIADYVAKARKSPTKDYEPSRLAEVCMQIYESPEYQAEIERIVKKYCKECE